MEQCSQEVLTKAIDRYRETIGKGEIDMFVLDNLVRQIKEELVYNNKGKKK